MKKLFAIAMSSGLAFSAAASEPVLLKGPVPAAPLRNWISADDFPAATLNSATAVGPAAFALTISTKGSVVGCAVERSSGSAPLDDTACFIFKQRGRFAPALDSSGKPVIGVYRVNALWGVAGQAAQPVPLVEMAVQLKAIPDGLPDPAYVDIAVSVDETGRVDGCIPAEGLSWAGQPIAERQTAGKVLGTTACAEALRALKLKPGEDDKGKPVRSVQMATSLFIANVPAPAASAAPAGSGPTASMPAPPALPVDPAAILVEGRKIRSLITRPETKIPYRGLNPVVDFEPVGMEIVLLKTQGDQWYRATLEPLCIGNSSMMGFDAPPPPGKPKQEGMGFATNDDGTFDRFSYIYAVVLDDFDSTRLVRRDCKIISLVESAPPKRRKNSRRSVVAAKPATAVAPALAAQKPTQAPDGGPIHSVEWHQRPTAAQMERMSGARSGSGWIMCQTAPDYQVRNCRIASETPRWSGIANRMKLESGKFRVQPPMVGGRPLVGAWVAIGFDFTVNRKAQIFCNPIDDWDPC